MAAGVLVFVALVGLILLLASRHGARKESPRRNDRGDTSSGGGTTATDCDAGSPCSGGDGGGDGD